MLENLISSHGYWILVLGCLMEGETALLLAGFAAHQQYLSLPMVIVVACIAGATGDLTLFFLGRRQGPKLFARFPSLMRHSQRVDRLIARWPHLIIIGVRFAYGLRLAGPLLIGASTVPMTRFVVLNLVGAFLWATIFALLGWVFGRAATSVFGHLQHIEAWLLVGLALVAVAMGAWFALKNRAMTASKPTDAKL